MDEPTAEGLRELAAWLESADAEPPARGAPWDRLAAWTAELDRRLAAHPAASHRAALAEAERLLARLLARSPGALANFPALRQVRRLLDDVSAHLAGGEGAPAPPELSPLPWSGPGGLGEVHPEGPALLALLAPLRAALPRGESLALAPTGWLGAAAAWRAVEPAEVHAALRQALVPWLAGAGDPLRARAGAALDRLEVASPCPVAWASLEGEGAVRHCGHCQQRVHDLSALDRAEAAALLAAHEGRRLCVRLYRRADGGVMTRDCPRVPAPVEVLGIVAPRPSGPPPEELAARRDGIVLEPDGPPLDPSA